MVGSLFRHLQGGAEVASKTLGLFMSVVFKTTLINLKYGVQSWTTTVMMSCFVCKFAAT